MKNIDKSFYNTNILQLIRLFFFACAVFCYYFQFPLRFLSNYIIPFLGIYLILSFRLIIKNLNVRIFLLISSYYIYISMILIMSSFKFIELSRILRFFIILAALPLFCFVIFYDTKNQLLKIFIFLSILKALSQVIVYTLVLRVGSFEPFRYFAKSKGMGDIYPYMGFFIKIQVLGTPLLLFALMLYFETKRKCDWIFILLLVGVLLSGNFAFILGLICFFIFKVYDYVIANKVRFPIRICVSLLILFLLAMVLFPFFKNEIKSKSEYSNIVRLEQTKALMTGNIILGNGFGNFIETKGLVTNYLGEIYFELQSLYIINQFGILGFLYFNFIVFYFLSCTGKNIMRLYFLYLLYSFWNPYCFDTTHMMVIAVLVNTEITKGNRYV